MIESATTADEEDNYEC